MIIFWNTDISLDITNIGPDYEDTILCIHGVNGACELCEMEGEL